MSASNMYLCIIVFFLFSIILENHVTRAQQAWIQVTWLIRTRFYSNSLAVNGDYLTRWFIGRQREKKEQLEEKTERRDVPEPRPSDSSIDESAIHLQVDVWTRMNNARRSSPRLSR